MGEGNVIPFLYCTLEAGVAVEGGAGGAGHGGQPGKEPGQRP